MPRSPRCRLTPKDYAVLKDLLDKEARCRDEVFLRQLRRKLATAIVLFPGDVDHRVAAIGSRVHFTANGGVPQSRVLVGDDQDAARADAEARVLPVSSRWGLALLGLAAGETVSVQDPSGSDLRLRLERVEAVSEGPAGAHSGERRNGGATVLEFSRCTARPRAAASWTPLDPDDDPGPSAA